MASVFDVPETSAYHVLATRLRALEGGVNHANVGNEDGGNSGPQPGSEGDVRTVQQNVFVEKHTKEETNIVEGEARASSAEVVEIGQSKAPVVSSNVEQGVDLFSDSSDGGLESLYVRSEEGTLEADEGKAIDEGTTGSDDTNTAGDARFTFVDNETDGGVEEEHGPEDEIQNVEPLAESRFDDEQKQDGEGKHEDANFREQGDGEEHKDGDDGSREEFEVEVRENMRGNDDKAETSDTVESDETQASSAATQDDKSRPKDDDDSDNFQLGKEAIVEYVAAGAVADGDEGKDSRDQDVDDDIDDEYGGGFDDEDDIGDDYGDGFDDDSDGNEIQSVTGEDVKIQSKKVDASDVRGLPKEEEKMKDENGKLSSSVDEFEDDFDDEDEEDMQNAASTDSYGSFEDEDAVEGAHKSGEDGASGFEEDDDYSDFDDD